MPEDTDEPPLRTCPSCGREARTRFERCPHCSTSYFDTPRAVRRRRTTILVSVVVVLVLAAAGGAVALRSDHQSRTKREQASVGRDIAALRARLRRIQAPHRGAAVALRAPTGAGDAQLLAARRALVGAVESSITADARARARSGELDGPIAMTKCGPILKSKTAIPDDRVLTKKVGRYDCVAIKHHIVGTDGKAVAELGHPFVAALDFTRFTYTWCRNTPAQGERGKSLVFVRLQRACLAATGRALGTGYVEDDGGG